MDSNYKIRQMTKEDLKTMVTWANEESWNSSESDAFANFQIDPNGFFAGELNGELIATLSAVKYNNYCHLGYYLVKKAFRGKGYGLKLFEHAMNYAKDVKVIGLDGVEMQKGNYEKWGFRSHDLILRYDRKAEGKFHENLVDLKQIPLEQIVEYDQNLFGDPRPTFLKALLSQEGYHGLGVIKEDRLIGYGILRKAYTGYRIGPFIADDKKTATEILDGLQSLANDQQIQIDIFQSNPNALELIDTSVWKPAFNMHRMYVKDVKKMDVSKVYSPIVEVG